MCWRCGPELTRRYAATMFDSALVNTRPFEKAWNVFDIMIDGDLDAPQGLRFSYFQTYQSYHGGNADVPPFVKG